MKYVIIIRGANEPDNNTPADVIWVGVMEFAVMNKEDIEKTITDEWGKDYDCGVDVQLFTLDELDGTYRKALELW